MSIFSLFRRRRHLPDVTGAFRDLIAREIWAYHECPWSFDDPPAGMGQLQKQIAVDTAERIRAKLFGSRLMACWVAEQRRRWP